MPPRVHADPSPLSPDRDGRVPATPPVPGDDDIGPGRSAGAVWSRVSRRAYAPARGRRGAALAAAAVAVWGVVVAAGILVGTARVAGRDELAVRAAPLVGSWVWDADARFLPAAALGIAVVVAGPRLAAAAPWRALVPSAAAATVAWSTLLAAGRGREAVTAPLATRWEYLAVVGDIEGPGDFLRTFTERLGGYPTHVKGHPPGMPLALWVLDRLGLGGEGWAAFLVLAGAGLATAATLLAVRATAGEPAARRAAPFVAVAPTALWLATTADALFAGVGAAGVALVVAGGGRRPGAASRTAAGEPADPRPRSAVAALAPTGRTPDGPPAALATASHTAGSASVTMAPGTMAPGTTIARGTTIAPGAADPTAAKPTAAPAAAAERTAAPRGGAGRRRAVALAVVGGATLALAAYLTYGAVPLVALPVAVAVVRRDLRPLGWATLGAAAVVAAFSVSGFWWPDGLAATREAYEAGVADVRPYGLFVGLLNPAALALATGPAAAAGVALAARAALGRVTLALPPVTRPRVTLPRPTAPARRRAARPDDGSADDRAGRPGRTGLWALPLAAAGALLAANLSGLSKGEVERIWLPFMPWLLAGAAFLAAAGRRDRTRWWLAAQVGATLVLAVALDSPW